MILSKLIDKNISFISNMFNDKNKKDRVKEKIKEIQKFVNDNYILQRDYKKSKRSRDMYKEKIKILKKEIVSLNQCLRLLKKSVKK